MAHHIHSILLEPHHIYSILQELKTNQNACTVFYSILNTDHCKQDGEALNPLRIVFLLFHGWKSNIVEKVPVLFGS